MSEVKLEDLLEMNAAPAANADPARPDLAPAQVVTAVTQQVEEIQVMGNGDLEYRFTDGRTVTWEKV